MNFQEAINTGKVTQEQAFQIFDSFSIVQPEEIFGNWKGSELISGHPADGSLTATGWFGKRFTDVETVDPLLFYTHDGGVFAADPIKLRSGGGSQQKAADRQQEIETNQPTARLRLVNYRGKTSAAMIYDQLPIIDHFRRVDAETILGAMDARNDMFTYFFVLHKVE
ncbi:DUF4334 domain-containing protein [Serratia quinivorans]|uniref:DUF4334 domain-containing protein n=1 Tax=Serratia quinivorans TaxID=137545 RepID=UPI002177DFF8|nr:DUF4334 domain-containing protein [Serratia quinivorans]CAI1555546.1 Uncharacterised protein [Serratia quinivorans]CAI1634000.1 Uncharacterised protein [Serratia quinivorans]